MLFTVVADSNSDHALVSKVSTTSVHGLFFYGAVAQSVHVHPAVYRCQQRRKLSQLELADAQGEDYQTAAGRH